MTSDLEPGVYVLRNLRSDSVIDLSGGDGKSIIGFPRHGLENQQWEFGTLGDGWFIRSVYTGKFLTIENGLGNGFPVVASGYPTSWVVEKEVEEDNGSGIYRIIWPNTPFSLDLDNGDPTPGSKVNLWTRNSGASHQMWELQRCADKDDGEKRSEVDTITETSTPESITTTTTTTVTTTTVTTRRFIRGVEQF